MYRISTDGTFISLTVPLPIPYLEAIAASEWFLLSKLSFSSIVNTFRLRSARTTHGKQHQIINSGPCTQQLDIT